MLKPKQIITSDKAEADTTTNHSFNACSLLPELKRTPSPKKYAKNKTKTNIQPPESHEDKTLIEETVVFRELYFQKVVEKRGPQNKYRKK